MTIKTCAIFDHGHFTPLEPLRDIPEHSVVELSVERADRYSKEEQLAMLLVGPVDEELAANIEAGRDSKWITEEF